MESHIIRIQKWHRQLEVIYKKIESQVIYKKMESHIIRIQKWYRQLPECRKCNSKRLAFPGLCVYCYHDKYSDTCLACKDGTAHSY